MISAHVAVYSHTLCFIFCLGLLCTLLSRFLVVWQYLWSLLSYPLGLQTFFSQHSWTRVLSLLTLVCEHCTVAMIYLLSLRISSLFTRVFRRLLLHFLLMVMWLIWFSVLPIWWDPCDFVHRLCGKTLPPITKSLNVHKSANSSPFSFMVPSPCFPIISSLPVLSEPTFAFVSPIRIAMSLLDVSSSTFCCLLYCLFFFCFFVFTVCWGIARDHTNIPTNWFESCCNDSWWHRVTLHACVHGLHLYVLSISCVLL